MKLKIIFQHSYVIDWLQCSICANYLANVSPLSTRSEDDEGLG